MFITQLQTIENRAQKDNSGSSEGGQGGQPFVSAFRSMLSAMLAPVGSKDKANETFNKKFTDINGKEGKIRTIEDALDEIEAIVRRMEADR